MFLESLPCPPAKLSALKLDNVMALEEGSNVTCHGDAGYGHDRQVKNRPINARRAHGTALVVEEHLPLLGKVGLVQYR